MRKRERYTTVIVASLLVSSCGTNQPESAEDTIAYASVAETAAMTEVTVMLLTPKIFTHEVVSNGKVVAGAYADLQFSSAGVVVDRIMVKNGQHVSKGQVIATLDRFKAENAVTTARTAMERAKLDLADAVIGQGYDPEQPESIPTEVMRLARLRSGVSQSEVQLAEAERALTDATLRAPFAGVVANLFQKEGNLPDGSQVFCRVIADGAMDVDFQILESELSLIHSGDAVEVSPYTEPSRTVGGAVTEINPVVDKNGMVKVRARIGCDSNLYDGMNVRISVKRNVERALVVPKSAVVLRSGGRKVVFTHENGQAIWNYVTTSLENMTEYVVTDGLTTGQEVIVTGNLNLAHESPVKVIMRD